MEPVALEAACLTWLGRHAGPTETGPEGAALDSGQLHRLRTALDRGGNATLRRLVETFVAETAPRLATLRRVVDGIDRPAIRQVAHVLRGSCGNMGARRMMELAGRLERGAGEGEAAVLEALAADLEAAFPRAEAALRSILVPVSVP